MKVRFDEISVEGTRLTITDAAWFPDYELERRGKVAAAVFLRRAGKRVFLEGTLSATVLLICDRCLESYARSLGDDFRVEFELADGDGSAPLTGEHEIEAEEMDTIFLDEAAIDLFDVLRQQVFMALPDKLLCGDDCQGLCSSCGTNLNKGKCRCGTKGKESPFSVLAGLMNIKE